MSRVVWRFPRDVNEPFLRREWVLNCSIPRCMDKLTGLSAEVQLNGDMESLDETEMLLLMRSRWPYGVTAGGNVFTV